ncbi:uncharacterized protein A1O5_10006 [Cladophialophora psammophila CBS 110553]|uniref:HypA protein n=1 Tax=Cladophialophora psammophila CBS 110553 TaxID=1182543 RepID=W9WQ70_9EURO|nr:uncharacterized protein A1O5_10006 [Cladophialophora psammophila CBS 110553]EXJ66811.1 hypothetical protein A1O5_10006 [Cladophialophora psammophila CBS 110553]
MTDFPLTVSTTGVYHVPEVSKDSAERTASLLRANHAAFHVFFNFKGYHNHQVHYLLTAYALGANPAQLQTAFDTNISYQRPRIPVDESIVRKLSNERFFKSLVGNDTYFNDYTAFFQCKFEAEGWQKVVNDYLFSRTELADDLLVRLHAGIIHPLIHFGFGIEFQQPPIIAEALAQAVCHNNFFGPFLLQAEQLAKGRTNEECPPLLDLMKEIREDPSLYDKNYWDGGDSLLDKILADAPQRVIEIASKWRVDVQDLDLRTAEMMNVNAWMAGAAQRHDKEVKLDFFFIHSVNCSIFFSAINAQPWLSDENKARLLEWKVRMDILQYASRLAPELHNEEVVNYKPRESGRSWASIIETTNSITYDDGHISKLVRALAHGSKVCNPYEERQELSARFPLKAAGWLQIANMAIDTTNAPTVPARWVRGAGDVKNWESFGSRL